MARPYRLQGEGLLYHITSRGDDRKKIFISDYDFNKFLEYLALAKDKYKFYLYAYCLMSNHYHLFLETTDANLSRIMQYINTSYTIYYNKKRNKCGHLFQGRYKSILVEADTYFKKLTRYIHLNPVKAKIVENPKQYRWSSYNDYLKGKSDIIDIPRLKTLLDMSLKQYPSFVNKIEDKPFDPFKNTYAGFLLGRKDFIKEQLEELAAQTAEKDFAYKRNVCSIDHDGIIDVTVKVYNIDKSLLFRSAQKPLLAKKAAVYLLKKYSSLTNKGIGELFGLSYSAVSKINSDVKSMLVKDKRFKKEIERIISHLKV